MNPKFLTNLTSVLLACNTSFNEEPPIGISLMRFALRGGQVQKHEVIGGKETITPLNVTCDGTNNGFIGIRLQPIENSGNLSIGGQVDKGEYACPVYGQDQLIPINNLFPQTSSATRFFILGRKLYIHKCINGNSINIEFGELNSVYKHESFVNNPAVPCTPFGINHQDSVIVFEKDGECKRINVGRWDTVKDCYQSKIFKPFGMYETEFYSLRYLTIMYPKCYTNLNLPQNGTELDNIHVKYLFKQPTTVVIPTTTTLPEKSQTPVMLLVAAGIVAFLFLVGLAVGLFIWKGPCGKKEKPMKEKEERALGVAEPGQPKEGEKEGHEIKKVQK